MLLLSGYTFYRQRTQNNKRVRWLCSTHYSKGCRAVVYTIEDQIERANDEHNHWPSINWLQPTSTHRIAPKPEVQFHVLNKEGLERKLHDVHKTSFSYVMQ